MCCVMVSVLCLFMVPVVAGHVLLLFPAWCLIDGNYKQKHPMLPGRTNSISTTSTIIISGIMIIMVVSIISVYIYVYIYIHTHTYIHTHVHLYVYIYIYICIERERVIYIHTYIHIYIYIHMYTYPKY